jgi:hypothetical protein
MSFIAAGLSSAQRSSGSDLLPLDLRLLLCSEATVLFNIYFSGPGHWNHFFKLETSSGIYVVVVCNQRNVECTRKIDYCHSKGAYRFALTHGWLFGLRPGSGPRASSHAAAAAARAPASQPPPPPPPPPPGAATYCGCGRQPSNSKILKWRRPRLHQ